MLSVPAVSRFLAMPFFHPIGVQLFARIHSVVRRIVIITIGELLVLLCETVWRLTRRILTKRLPAQGNRRGIDLPGVSGIAEVIVVSKIGAKCEFI